MGNGGKHMISSKEVMVDLKCSSLSNSQDVGHPLQAYLKCLHHHVTIIQSFSKHLPPLLYPDAFSAHLEDTLFATQ
jgi:hypothetical protein